MGDQRGRRLHGRGHRRYATLPGWRPAAAALLLAAGIGLAACGGGSGASPEASPGAGAAVRAELLFVVQAAGATLSLPGPDGRAILHLTGVAPSLLAFADRPLRIASVRPTSTLVDGWAGYGFTADPPNGALTAGAATLDEPIALELRDPRLDATAATLDFTVTSLSPDPAAMLGTRLASGGSVSLFVDATAPSQAGTPPATADVAELVDTLGSLTGQSFSPAQQELISRAAAILLQEAATNASHDDTQLNQSNVGLFIDDLQQVLAVSFTAEERQILTRALVRMIGTGT